MPEDLVMKLWAMEQIRQLKARYFRAIDTKDRALLSRCFTADGTADFRGANTDPRTGVDAVPICSEELLQGNDMVVSVLMDAEQDLEAVHHGSNPEIEVLDADNARGVWAMADRLRMKTDPEVAAMDGWGHYHETYRRENGEWKIRSLKLTRLRLDVYPRCPPGKTPPTASDDRSEIVNVLNLYGYAMDSQAWHLFDRIFTPNARVVFSDAPETGWTDREAFKRDFAAQHVTLDRTQHAMSGHIVNLQGDRANAITYGIWRLIKTGTVGGDYWEGAGWYDDALVRTPDGWRISERTCRTLCWGGNVRVIETVPGIRFDLPVNSMRTVREAGDCAFARSLG